MAWLGTMQHWRPQYGSNPDGKLWVATVQGLAMLDLQHLSFDSAKPAVFLEDVTVGRVRQFPGHELVLPPGTHHVDIRLPIRKRSFLAMPEKWNRNEARRDGCREVTQVSWPGTAVLVQR